ncbi:TetR/AcrR family transcriptional regulator [Streptomyces sp. NPDC059568]|uniref:TetR/AcrR family transcriptional regulator n=1 Tax=Streptomyces sp. NPDC059568 TaxID=3346868 RepID=UPI00368EABA5
MTGPDRPRRGYDSSGRQAAAARNRAAILDACRESLLRDGYRATSVQAVARRAGVSVPTVYKAFGSKQELVKAVYDTTLAQDDEPVPMHARPELRAVLAETDPAEKLAGYARFVAGVHERLAALTAVLSAADPELAELAAVTDRERRTGTGAFVDHLATAGMLRPGLDPVRAADSCWLLTSPQVHERLTRGRGWTASEYRQWLAQMLAAALLP